MNLFRATVIGWMSSLVVSDSAKTNSPQVKRKAKARDRDQTRPDQWQDDPPEGAEAGAAVDERGRLQLHRHREEEGPQDDDRERQGDRVASARISAG